MLLHWIWYAQLDGLSQRQKIALLSHFHSPEDIFYAHKADLELLEGVDASVLEALENKNLEEARSIIRSCEQGRIGVLTYRDALYPARLRSVADAPVVLYYRGLVPDFEAQPVVAVVGTRKASAYGLSAAGTLSRQIACCGGLVISGAAAGIDTAAMEGALQTGHQTVGVLGCGVDVVYPKSNKSLYAQTEKMGCLLSEYPPGSQPERWHFPQRNRILSGIANAVLVVEAPESSGALITARRALEQGRDVFAVPGNIDSASCAGGNALLQEGAGAACEGWDVLRDYEPLYPDIVKKRPVTMSQPPKTEPQPLIKEIPREKADKKDVDNPGKTPYSVINEQLSRLTEEEKAILACLGPEPRLVDAVIAQVGEPAGKTLSLLTKLSLKGLVVNHPGRLVSAPILKQ